MSQIQVNCPNCQKTLRMGDDVRGKTIRCPACQKAFGVGGAVEPAAAPQSTRKRPADATSTDRPAKSTPAEKPKRRSRRTSPEAKGQGKGQRKSNETDPPKRKRRRRTADAEVAAWADPWDDEFDDDFDDMDGFDDDAPPVRSRSKKKSGRKKSRGGSGIQRILLIMLFGFVGVGAVGGVGYGIYKIAPSLLGSNVVSLKYFPENLGGFVHYRVADIVTTPLAQEYLAAAGSPLDDFKVAGLPEAAQIKSITMGMNRTDLSSGFNRMRNSTMRDGLIVVRLASAFDPAATPDSTGEDYGGETIYQRGAVMLWCPDATTIVAGPRSQVTEAIDRGGREFRFRQFDFGNVKHHLSMVVAETATRGSDQGLRQPSGVPAVDSLAASANKNLQGVCLGLSLSTGVDADLIVRCYGSSEATNLKGEIDNGITQLKQMASSNPMLAQVSSLANELFGGLETTQSGRMIYMSLAIDKSMIDRVKQLTGGMQ